MPTIIESKTITLGTVCEKCKNVDHFAMAYKGDLEPGEEDKLDVKALLVGLACSACVSDKIDAVEVHIVKHIEEV